MNVRRQTRPSLVLTPNAADCAAGRIFRGIAGNLNPLTLQFYRSVMQADEDGWGKPEEDGGDRAAAVFAG